MARTRLVMSALIASHALAVTALAQPADPCSARPAFATLPEEPVAASTSSEPPAAQARRAEALSTSDPARPSAMLAAAEALRHAGASDEAVRVLARIVLDHPRAPMMDRVLFRLGTGLFALRRDDDARQVFMRLIRDHPSSPYVAAGYASLGDHYSNEDDGTAAARFFERAADLPGRFQAYVLYRLAWARASVGEPAALDALDRARVALDGPGVLAPPALRAAIQRERTAIAALARCP